jgi:hypothetical protein
LDRNSKYQGKSVQLGFQRGPALGQEEEEKHAKISMESREGGVARWRVASRIGRSDGEPRRCRERKDFATGEGSGRRRLPELSLCMRRSKDSGDGPAHERRGEGRGGTGRQAASEANEEAQRQGSRRPRPS